MKVAAVLTSRVMEAVCHLPGVATLDWCDRAAAALSRLHHPCLVAMVLGTVDSRGFLLRVEVAGAAASTGLDGAARPASEAALGALRQSYAQNEWIGWNVGPLAEDAWFVATASAQGLLASRQESPLVRRWESLGVADVLLAAVAMPGSAPGRMMLIEIGAGDAAFRDTSREQSVLAACLPMLGHRAAGALGTEPGDKHSWLTPREELILWHLVAGKKVPQIAAELHRSIYTVHDHVKSLHRKLGASNRGQLVARALGHLGPLNRPLAPEPDAAGAPAAGNGVTVRPSAAARR